MTPPLFAPVFHIGFRYAILFISRHFFSLFIHAMFLLIDYFSPPPPLLYADIF